MHQTMHNAGGIGLAATQVGKLNRIITLDLSEIEEMKDMKPLTMINPEVVSQEGQFTMEEGCLSIPDVRDEVNRPERIVVRYRDTDFQEQTIEGGEVLARVILHEIDHLNGTLFLDHISAVQRKLHRDKLKLMEKGEIDVSYPVITAAKIAVP
jgi:peptide deformylase